MWCGWEESCSARDSYAPAIHSLTMLYVTYGLSLRFWIAFAYGITIGNTVRFFPDKRGLIAGISTAAYGAGSIIFPPIM